MAGAMSRFDYVSDDTNTYNVKLDSSNAAAVGAEPATGAVSPPSGLVKRYLLAQHANGRQRKIVVCDPGVPLWTTPGGTLNLPDFTTMTTVSWTIRGRVGEKRYAR